ncbi:hypothetical protein D6833_08370 [Candidatus Parcubacteria bacterium]|nr:MAG: hypothetical protein D6833_08370 [Candidatus Parcubacteria bacterium]
MSPMLRDLLRDQDELLQKMVARAARSRGAVFHPRAGLLDSYAIGAASLAPRDAHQIAAHLAKCRWCASAVQKIQKCACGAFIWKEARFFLPRH